MTDQKSMPINSQTLEEASQWFIGFRLQETDPGTCEQFDDWLRRSPDNIRAYLEISETYATLPPREALGNFDAKAFAAEARAAKNVVSFGSHREGYATQMNPDALGTRNRRVHWGLAASFVALTLGGIAAWFIVDPGETYSTAIGEQRSLALPDGSTVNLNAKSKIKVRFSSRARDIDLVEGQALFLVALDKHRAFTVHSDEVKIRALGTQFDVNRKDSGTTVTVLEGRVTVSSLRAGVQQKTEEFSSLLSPGQQVTVTPKITPQPRLANMAAATAWTQRRLVFEGIVLDDVVKEFNRFNTRRMVIDTPALGSMRISGVYSSTDPASLLTFLRDQRGVAVIEQSTVIRIRSQ